MSYDPSYHPASDFTLIDCSGKKKMNMIERVAMAIFDVQGHEYSFETFDDDTQNQLKIEAKAAIEAMRDPSDKLLLAPGEPYRIQKAVHVPISEGIKLRRIAWNKIIDAALKEE